MKYLQSFLILICLSIIPTQTSHGQSNTKPTIVLVHGAWGGGWAFKEVDSILTSQGAVVYRPTLTGQGEKVHLATKDIGLETHITDIVNTILFEELDNLILVGHSYGGMVVTGVADRIPERIQKLVYVDAFVPENGESASSIRGTLTKYTDNFIIPTWVPKNAPYPKDVPHPTKTLTDKITLTNVLRLKIPTNYILTVDKGKLPEKDNFASQASRAKNKNWPVLHLEANHNMQWSAPKKFSQMLMNIANN